MTIIYDYNERSQFQHPDGFQWLEEQRYQIEGYMEYSEGVRFGLFKKSEDNWATYHPQIGSLQDTNIVYHGIFTKELAVHLIETAYQLLGPLEQMDKLRSGEAPAKGMTGILVTRDNLNAVVQAVVEDMFGPAES